jgi:aspartyl-tRNA(Asn)/glutamyl-tRNA(Gln) amidotransferase subunit C
MGRRGVRRWGYAMPDKLTEEQVRHVAKLSRLTLSDAEIRDFAGQLSHVLDYFSKLDELNVEGVEPMAHAQDLVNVLREDRETVSMPLEQVLANAPAKDPPFFKVTKVLGEGSGA